MSAPVESAVEQRTPPPHFGAGAVGLSLLTALLWGGTAVGSRIALDTLPPIAVGGARFALAALFMIAWCRWERAPLTLQSGQWGPSFWSGLLLFLQIATFNWGQARSTASHSTLFINTYIFWVAAVEHYVTRTYRLDLRQILGLFVAAAGVVLLVATSAAPSTAATRAAGRDVATLTGDLLLLLSALLLAIKVIYTKHAVRTVPPGTLTLWHDVIGVALFVAWSAAFEQTDWRRVDAATVWSLLFLGVAVSGFCFAAQAWLLQKHSASLVSVFSFATPVFGVLLAVLLRGDVLSPWLLAAGVSVAVGILLVTLRGPGA